MHGRFLAEAFPIKASDYSAERKHKALLLGLRRMILREFGRGLDPLRSKQCPCAYRHEPSSTN